jgi:hypothetical protein
VHKAGLGMPPLHGALSLLYHRGFQQVSQLLLTVFPSSVEGSGVVRMNMVATMTFWLARGKMGDSLLLC